MVLQELIDTLSRYNPATHVPLGFGKPHSYRGYYDELAFEPVPDTTVGAMLTDAKEAFGRTYSGYKGGDYTMDGFTPVWLARYGDTGEGLGCTLLSLLLSAGGKEPDTLVTPIETNRPRFTAVPDETEPGRKVLCRIVDWDDNEDAPATEVKPRVLIGGLTPREAVVGAHLLDDTVRHLGYEPTAEMVDALVAFRFPSKALRPPWRFTAVVLDDEANGEKSK